MNKLFYISLLLFFSIYSHGQDLMESLNAPSNIYHNIELAEYNGMPLLGMHTANPNQFQFQLLTEMNFLKAEYDQMQVKVPSAGLRGRNRVKESYASQRAQNNLVQLLTASFNANGYNKYFCAEQNCIQDNMTKRRSPQAMRMGYWGGSRADEFDSRGAFTNFIENEIDQLRQWAEKIPKEAYIIKSHALGSYDFDKEAFQISLSLRPISGPLLYNPNKLMNISSNAYLENDKTYNFLIPMSQTDARNLNEEIGDRRMIYAIYKIKINAAHTYTSLKPDYRWLGFHLTSPVVEIFSDSELKNKICEVTIDL